ncbi:tetratricopeptide repeat protein, partial [Nocardia sp. NPDC003482]
MSGTGNRSGEATTLTDLGVVASLRDDEQAIDLLAQASVIHDELQDLIGTANALADLGRVISVSGNHKQAISLFREALIIYRTLGATLSETDTRPLPSNRLASTPSDKEGCVQQDGVRPDASEVVACRSRVEGGHRVILQ